MESHGDWTRLRTWFDAASELRGAERTAFVERECADDPALKAELLALLAAHDAGDDDFLASPATPSEAPRRIGDYTLEEAIGSGGMGTVYRATQESPHRTVALKILRTAGWSPRDARRLEAEAEILARLHHPGIAQIHAAGIHREGSTDVPWFAMEYVQGALPVTDHAQQNRLDLDARLRLFAAICDAVQHAHQKGVIHRDLKPGNVLVDADGTPKVIDFGVARVTGSDLRTDTMHTAAGELIGTLSYMSPEQCRGDAAQVDIRCDVYALGVMLFELITDERPFPIDDLALPDALETVIHQAPMRSAKLTGDLEAIAFMAMDKEPDRRYDSAAALASDIESYLTDAPVQARPPTLSYHLRLLVRRHRPLFAAASILLVGLAAATMVSLWFAFEAADRATEAERARTRAADERDAATEALELWADALGAANPLQEEQRNISVSEVFQRTSETLSPQAHPRVRARIHQMLASGYHGTNDHELALEHASRAVAALDEIDGETPHQRAASLLLMGVSQHLLKRTEEAIATLEVALTLANRPHGPEETSGINPVVVLARLATVLGDHGDLTRAEAVLEDALSRPPPPPDRSSALAEACATFGSIKWRTGEVEAAAAYWERAIDLFERGLWDDHPFLVQTRSNYGMALQMRGEDERAIEMFEGALEAAIAKDGPDSPDAANALLKVGFLHLERGRFDEAETTMGRALAIRRANDPARVPDALRLMAYSALQQERFGRAATHLEEGLQLQEQALPTGHPEIAATQLLLGRAYLGNGRLEEAQPMLEAAARTRAAAFGPSSPRTAMARSALGECHVALGQLSAAAPLLVDTYPVIEQAVGHDHAEAAAARRRLAAFHEARGEAEEAARWRR